MPRYKLRKATDQDNVAINQLYNRIPERRRPDWQRPDAEYAWEWLENPAGESERWVIYEESTGEIVGHHGLIPIQFNDRGTELLAGKTENTMVAPEHRNNFVYPSYEKRILEEARKRFDYFLTTAGTKLLGKIRESLGYQILGKWASVLIYVSRRYVESHPLDRLGTWKVPLVLRPHLRRLSVHALPAMTAYRDFRIWRGQYVPGIRMKEGLVFAEHKEELEVFWLENKKHFGPTPERNGAYLEWRFHRNPYNKYRLFLFYEGSELQGYAWIRRGELPKGDKVLYRMVIEDMVAAKNDQRLYLSFLKNLLREANNYDSMVMKTVVSDDALNRALRIARLAPWRNQPENHPFYALAHKPGLSLKGWFITEALSEGVIKD